jgi:hypothetical protein
VSIDSLVARYWKINIPTGFDVFEFSKIFALDPMVAVDAPTRNRIGISAVMAEILKFYGNYDDMRIRGQKKRSQK